MKDFLVKCGGWYLKLMVSIIDKMYLDIAEVDKLPSFEAGPDSQIHVFDGGPVIPASCFVQCSNAPHAGGPWSMKSVSLLDAKDDKMPILGKIDVVC